MGRAPRIVSLVPSHTETLHDIGLQDHVVGRTQFCILPAYWVESIPKVGGTKDAKLERILDLQPTHVIADKDENPKALVDALVDAGVAVIWSDIETAADAADFIEALGQQFHEVAGVRAQAEAWAKRIRAAIPAKQEDPIPVFCPIWYQPWMTFDRTAYPHAMLEAVGFRNVFAHHAGPKYFEVDASDIEASGARLILLPTEPFPFHKQLRKLDWTGIERPYQCIDGEALTWFGTRTLIGLEQLRESHEEAQRRLA